MLERGGSAQGLCIATQELLGLLEPDIDDYLTPYFMKTSLLDDSENGPNILNIDLGLDGRLALSAAYMNLDKTV